MSHDAWTDRLSDYLDGAMGDAERGACEAHLASCAECAHALAELREIVERAHALPDRAPDRDLWPEIEARLASRAPQRARRILALPRHIHLTLPQAIAAGVVLVALSGSVVWWMLRHEGAPGALSSGPVAARPGATPQVTPGTIAPAPAGGARSQPSPAAGSSSRDVAQYAAYEAHYDQAIAELERTLEEHRTELDTSTVRVVEQNLVIIDNAIAQARRALEADPASPYLHQHLALQMKLKLDLLRRTAAFAGQG